METLKVILQDLRSHDWAVSIDLKDAYLHVPVHPQSRRLLGFKFLGKAYTYKVLPFGLKDSPWVFSRIVATVIGHLRLQGIFKESSTIWTTGCWLWSLVLFSSLIF